MIEVRVLGEFSAALDGRPIGLPSDARARELLAWMVVAPEVRSRSSLAGRLRPEVPEESARKSLRDALYGLRRALGPSAHDALIATRDQVHLQDGVVKSDLWEVRRYLAAGELEAALAASTGDLLAGMDADWVIEARAHHDAQLAVALRTLASQAEQAGDPEAAVAWTRRRVELEPLAEAAHRDLVRLLAVSGDRPAALAAADSLTSRLRRELAVPPSAQTRALIDEVRRGRLAGGPAEAATQPSFPASLVRTVSPAGRHAELERVLAAWGDARSGTTRLVIVEGEAGIGKTTLAGAVARRAHGEGGAVVYGRSDDHALVPFQPWVELLERVIGELPPREASNWLEAHHGALARLLPEHAPGTPHVDPSRERYLAFATVGALLERLATRWPMVLVLDDLHWIDEDSAALLRHLVRTTPRLPALIMLCARHDELSEAAIRLLADIRRETPMLTLRLDGLDEEAVAAIVALRGGHDDPESVRQYLVRTGGNPFFLDELLRDEQERTTDSREPPAGVRALVAQRLALLGDDTTAALATAAALGLEFTLQTLSGVGATEPATVLDALGDATAAGLVTPAEYPGSYAFAHALVSETILGDLPAGRRAGLHLQIAHHLADCHAAGDARAAEVVRHLRAAAPLGEADRIFTWELRAAREASSALAYADAANHLEAALAALPDHPDRGEHLIDLGHAYDRAGQRELTRAAFLQAAALARQRDDAGLLARAALGHGGLAVVVGSADPTTADLLQEALDVMPRGDPPIAARLRARLATELFYDEPARADELSKAAVADARASGDRGVLAAALNARRVALWAPDHIFERLEIVEEMLAAAQSAGDRETVLQARNWRVVDLWELGRISEVAGEIDAYEELADDAGLPHYLWYVPLWRAGLALLAGRWDHASELAERALRLGSAADDPNAALLVRVQREVVLDVQRRFGEVDRRWVTQAAAASGEPAPWLAWQAMIDAATGRHDDAQATIDRLASNDFADLPMRANWLAACELAEAVADVGDRPAAAALHRRLAPHANLFAVIGRGVGCENVTEHYLGRLEETLGNHDAAAFRLRRAVTINDRVGAAPYAAWSLACLGRSLAVRGDLSSARKALTESIDRAALLGMDNLADDARALLQRTADAGSQGDPASS